MTHETIAKLNEELKRLRRIAAHVPPRIYIEAKERAGFGTAVVTDWVVQDDGVDQGEAVYARLVNELKSLRKYILIDGYPRPGVDDKKMLGFAYEGSQWGFVADPEYEAYEALQACEAWLHERLDALLAIAKNRAEKGDSLHS